MATLYRRCIFKTALLLKNSFWNEVYENEGSRQNPFSCMPATIVDDLLECVLRMSTSPHDLKVTDLYHLLTSGCVEHFELDDILLKSEEFVSILMSLSAACRNLRSVILRNLLFSDSYSVMQQTKRGMIQAALECLLSISPHLETIKSCVEFDLKAIRNCERLKVLEINFVPKVPVCDFLEEVDGHFWPNNSLTVLEVYQDLRHSVPYLEFVPILKYCPSLMQVNVDISHCLEYMHADEMADGTLNAQYNLKKCFLGSVPAGSATIAAVHIATLTCPFMKEVDILVNDNHVVYGLSDFQNLNSLLIQWESPSGGDFQLGIQLLLEKIGANLKNLHMINFYNVDFAAIAVKCPLVEELKLELNSEYCGYPIPAECFKFLRYLHVEIIEFQSGICENTLFMLLSNCTNLTKLHLQCATSLTDKVLATILSKNNLSGVIEASIFDSKLTGEGVRNLILHLESLEFFHFSSSRIVFEDASEITHEVNPHVLMIDMSPNLYT